MDEIKREVERQITRYANNPPSIRRRVVIGVAVVIGLWLLCRYGGG